MMAMPSDRDTRSTDNDGNAALGRRTIRRIVDSYRDFITRSYAKVRFTILRQPFLEEIDQYLPPAGRILDLGCGFGLFSLYFAALAPGRRIHGVDLDAKRIARAGKSARRLGLDNVKYETRNALEWDAVEPFDAIYLLDLVHHLPRSAVPVFLAKVRSLLQPDGILVIKDVADRPRYKMLFTLLLDRLMVGLEPIYYWPPVELTGLLRGLGFEVFRHRMTDVLPYPHMLYVCRPGEQGQRPAAGRAT